MSTEQQVLQAYEDLRRAELGKRGAEMYLEEASRDVEVCRCKLEQIIKSMPNRMIEQ